MKIADFKLEKWLNPLDPLAKHNLGASCVKALHMDELFELIGEDEDEFYEKELKNMSLHYGHFFGMERLLVALSKLYRDVKPSEILTAHGGTGANNLVITEIVEPGSNVVAFIPNYQQHYSIPESLGAEVRYLWLKEENKYLPDLNELKGLVDENTKLITISNPNNPTGSFIKEEMLREIGKIAGSVGAYVLCDEIYRGLDDDYMASIVDVYDRGIVTSSMSKVFSLAGTRVGWIVAKDKEMYNRLENRRSYDTICCGPFDELIAAIAIENKDKILARSKSIVYTNKKLLDEWLKTQAHLFCPNESFGTTVLISYDYDIATEKLCLDIFEETGLTLCHGDCFEMPKTFRLGYSMGNAEMFKTGLKVLGDYLKKLENYINFNVSIDEINNK